MINKKTFKIMGIVFLALFILMSVSACKIKDFDNWDYIDTKGNNSKLNLNNDISPRNASYTIDGEEYTLINGYNEKEITPDSTAKKVTKYFGNEVYLDLNNDGNEDVIFLLTQETSGSGSFFYAVAAINNDNSWEGSNAVFVGDRIAPQSTDLSTEYENVVVINYLERGANEALTDEPSQGKSLWLEFDSENMKLINIEQNEAI